jgi:hypothetical protein
LQTLRFVFINKLGTRYKRAPVGVKVSSILEIWEYVCNIGLSDEKQELTETAIVKNLFLELKRDIHDLKIKR